MDNPKDWSTSWIDFIAEVGRLVRAGATPDELDEAFAGQKVRWQGVIDECSLDALAPGVSVDMERVEVDLGKERRVSISGLHLPVEDQAIASWRTASKGEIVSFEATLGAGSAPFPAVEVETLSSGRTLLSVAVCRATLLRNDGASERA